METKSLNAYSRGLLTEWIKECYKGRTIRISGGPCFNHLAAVAEIASRFSDLGYEIGLCHDLLEDTQIEAGDLLTVLRGFGYVEESSAFITKAVVELTDSYTKESYPNFSKKERRRMEAKRLIAISAEAQTVKYADLIYNTDWMLIWEPEKAGNTSNEN